ncbi:MAG: hypothetical protein Q9220_006499 [cf. Caloplaca sp. 1 TL-2023]
MLLEATRGERRATSMESIHSYKASNPQSLEPYPTNAPHKRDGDTSIVLRDREVSEQTSPHRTSTPRPPSPTSDIAEIDGDEWKLSNHIRRQQQYEQSSLTGLEKLNQTMSDLYPNELHNPSTIGSLLPKPQREHAPSPKTISPQERNSMFRDLLQAAHREHATVKSTPLAANLTHERSPFRPESEFDGVQGHHNSAALMRARQKAESDRRVLADHQPSSDDLVAPRTISPKEVVLDYNEAEEQETTQQSGEGTADCFVDDGSPDEDLPINMGRFSMSINISEDFWSTPRWSPTDSSHALDKRAYYASPIMIRLSSLPEPLRNRPTDLFYFHFFLDNTARLLVSHECEDNPFRKVLPRMALQNENLLGLLLSYSAAHRANLLYHPPPFTRIAQWTKNVFPSLRRMITCVVPDKRLSTSDLAIAMVLTSMKVVTPRALETDTALSVYLTAAKNMMKHNMRVDDLIAPGEVKEESFLKNWLQYLDTMAAVSHLKVDRTSSPLPLYDQSDEIRPKSVKVDCLSGCSAALANILSTTHIDRKFSRWIDEPHDRDHGGISSHVSETLQASHILTSKLADTVLDSPLQRNCNKRGIATGMFDKLEIQAMQRLVSRANIVHRYRMVEGRRTLDSSVQYRVQEIIETLELVLPGRMEPGILYPLFIAGCEAQTPVQKDIVLNRYDRLEKLGMAQVGDMNPRYRVKLTLLPSLQVTAARKLMEKAWHSDKPWWVLSEGEFLGHG